MKFDSRRDVVSVILSGVFITNAIIAELIGGKLFELGPFSMSIGVIPWPVVLLTTDLVNEYFGVAGVRRLTFVTLCMIVYTFVVLYLATLVQAAPFSPVTDAQFAAVFGTSMWIIVGSITAFAISQVIDVSIFWYFKRRTKSRMLWLRATGSTAVSQLIDSVVIVGIAFWLPGKVKTADFVSVAISNYSYKLLIAVGLTPLIYLAHAAIDRYLAKKSVP